MVQWLQHSHLLWIWEGYYGFGVFIMGLGWFGDSVPSNVLMYLDALVKNGQLGLLDVSVGEAYAP